MKKNGLLLTLVLACLFLTSSCEEEGPFIDFSEPEVIIDTIIIDTTLFNFTVVDTSFITTDIPATQDKIVLIEEYSGVQCNNCPKGAEAVKVIKESFPGRVVSTTLHAGNFAVPYPESNEDFLINESIALNDFFGLFGYPSAVIDRHLFPSQNFIPVTIPEQWSSLVAGRLDVTSPVNLEVITAFNEETRQVFVTVTTVYTKAIANEYHQLSVFLTEDHIIDAQLMPDNSLNLTYEHEHVVRDMFTNWGGLVLDLTDEANGGYAQGSTFSKTFVLSVEDNWDENNLNVVACIHADGSSTKEVFQSIEQKVIE